MKYILSTLLVLLCLIASQASASKNQTSHAIVNINMETHTTSITYPPVQMTHVVAGASSQSPMYPVLPRQVIGTDDRLRVIDTSQYPWSAIVRITYTSDGISGFLCSGWMLGRSTIVTAAHCLYNEEGWGSSYVIQPGRDGNIIHGECRGIAGHVPQGWIDAVDRPGTSLSWSDRQYDFAGIDLNCRIGEETGVLGFRSTNDGDLIAMNGVVVGYPGPLNHPSGIDVGTSMWEGGGQLVNSGDAGVLRFTNDTTGGQSGGPVWQTSDIPTGCSTPCVIGISNAETNPIDNITPNGGARVTPATLDALVEWKQYLHPVRIFIPIIIKTPVPTNQYPRQNRA